MTSSPAPARERRTLLPSLLLPVVAVVGLLLTIHFGVPIKSGLWYRTFFDTLHVPVFALIGVSVFAGSGVLWPARTGWRVAVTLACIVVLSGISEAAQIPGPRDASFSDLVSDWLGGGSALLLALAVTLRNRGLRLRTLLAMTSVLLLGIALTPLATVSAAYVERNLQAPVVIRFDSRFNHLFLHPQNARLNYTWSAQLDAPAARVTFGEGPWPGLIFQDILPDWSDYDTLVLDITTPGEESIELNFRVHDRRHSQGDQPYADRYNTTFNLTSETRRIRIALADVADAPRGRRMDMSDIHGMVLFAAAGNAGREFLLSSVRLE